MNRSYKILGLLVLGMLTLAAAAYAQMYSQIGKTGTVTLGNEIARGLAPVSLAQGDWDGDGTPDLVAGFAAARSSRLVLFRGNPDAVYPNSPEAQKRRALGRAVHAPFVGELGSFEVPGRLKLLLAGDFDGDGRDDLAACTHGVAALVWLRGNGRGKFGKPQIVPLPGIPTALAVGEVNRRDGLEDLVVGVTGPAGPELILFASPFGAFVGASESVRLPATATSLALGQFDESFPRDVAVVADGEIYVAPGRDRHDVAAEVPTVTLQKLPALAGAVSIVTVLAAKSAGIDDLAVLTSDGAIEVLTREPEERAWHARATAVRLSPAGSRTALLSGSVNNPTGRGLFALDHEAGRVSILTSLEEEPHLKALIHFDRDLGAAGDDIVAIQPMRLNPDGLDDLVVLHRDGRLEVIFAAASVTYTVNTTSDVNDGVCNAAHCSLREAINLANANVGADTINFNVAGTGVKTISPTSALPIITDTVTIDGTTQPGYAGNPRIEINGTSAGSASGLQIDASNCVVRALAINRFSRQAGIYLYSERTLRSGSIVEGNRLGTDPSGTIARGNGDGVTISGSVHSTTVGGTTSAAGNTLSGNVSTGVYIGGGSENKIFNNYIGTKSGGSGALGNAYDGVYNNGFSTTIGGAYGNLIGNNGRYGVYLSFTNALVQGNLIGGDGMVGGSNTQGGIYVRYSNNTISATNTGLYSNTIFGNTGSAIIVVSSANGNQIRRNLIYGNGGLGIDLNGDGVTPNDAGDGDTGGNHLQNFPVITWASTSAVGISLNSTPNSTFAIDVFSADTFGCDPTGNGEGQWVSSGTLTTDASGNGSTSVPVSWGGTFTATATGPGNNTSEFSACRTAGM